LALEFQQVVLKELEEIKSEVKLIREILVKQGILDSKDQDQSLALRFETLEAVAEAEKWAEKEENCLNLVSLITLHT